MTDRLLHKIDFLLTTVGLLTGIASTLENVEQILRILLLFVSIISCFLLILVNWKAAIKQIKSFFKK